MVLYSGNPQKLYFKGVQKSILFTGPDQIIYMESIGNHTMIHMTTQSFECTERLNAVVERMQGSMLRCHSSYLVNPMYVESIERFALTLSDGSRIPIPEKKYTAVKDLLLHK